MKKKMVITSLGLIFIVAVAFALIRLSSSGAAATTAPLNQSEIEAKALQYAYTYGLQAAPTSIVLKQMPFSEYNARLDPFGRDNLSADTPVWLVVLQGKVVVRSAPNTTGVSTGINYNNMWLLLTSAGEVKGWGTRPDYNPIDLNLPPHPVSAWPTPAEQKK